LKTSQWLQSWALTESPDEQRGDHLAVADVNNDGRSDFVFSAGTGVLAFSTPQGFVEAKPGTVQFKSGSARPLFADLNGDGLPDLFVPQDGPGRFYANRSGQLTDATAESGALAQPIGMAVGATAVDFDADGKLDLVIGCLKGDKSLLPQQGTGAVRGRHR